MRPQPLRAAPLLIVLLAPAVAAQTPPAGAPAGARPSLRVVGEATVRFKPDQADIFLGVVTEAKTAAAAAAENARRMDKVLAGAKKLVAGKGDVTTSGYSVTQSYGQPRGPEPPRPTGYTVRNQAHVRLGDLALVSKVIDSAIELGANDVNGVSFSLKNPDDAQAEALRAAAQKARGRAAALASSLGVRVGRVISAEETSARPIPVFRDMAAMRTMEAQAATPIETGLIEVNATVTVTFEAVDGAAK